MKTIFRNFLTTLKRFRLASALNIFGLSVAFTVFLVILMQIRYDRSFDRFHPKADRLYRVELREKGTTDFMTSHSRMMADLMRQAPQVQQASLFRSDKSSGEYGPYLTVERNGEKIGFKESTARIFPEFTDMFDFEIVEGTRQGIEEPNRVMIPQSMARRFFGNAPAVDQRISFVNDSIAVMTVAAVYRDFPDNTLVNNDIYIPVLKDRPVQYDHWGNLAYSFFVTLDSPQAGEQLAQTWLGQLNAVQEIAQWFPLEEIRFTPVPDIYYLSDVEFDSAPRGNKTMMNILLGIAVLIIVIAAINFVNFATSLTPLRIKSINTQKVLGADTSTLRTALVGESVGISLFAFILALGWTVLISMTGFTRFLTASLGFGENLPVIGLTLIVALVVGLAAGIYPARYTTSFPPALVLKGSFGMSPQGKKLRTALVGFQFVVSIALIIAAIFMQVQNGFIRSMDTGLDTERVAVVELSDDLAENHQATLRSSLAQHAKIENVTFSSMLVGTHDSYSQWGFSNAGEEPMPVQVVMGEWDLPRFFDMEFIEGRDFLETERFAGNTKIIINEAAQKRYGMHVGQVTEKFGTEVVGIVENFNFQSLRRDIEPMAFMLSPYIASKWLYVRTSGDPAVVAAEIKSAVAAIDPTYPTEVQFYDTFMNALYEKEHRTTSLVTIFSMLAVIISLVGVFGLVMFETQYRRKEIGVRKVMGATVQQVLAMFNRRFVKIVAVCFVLAVPFAWYGVKMWLGSFAYRTPLHWWVFALSLAIVMLVTLSTVTIQSWRAAVANPVDSLRSE